MLRVVIILLAVFAAHALSGCGGAKERDDRYECIALQGITITCESNIDCVLAQTTCCDECNGGKEYAINRECLERFLEANKKECEVGQSCDDKVCSSPLVARCDRTNKRCYKTEQQTLDD